MEDSGVMDNSFYGLPPQKQLDEQKKWLAEADKMFKSYKAYKPNRALINNFLDTTFDFEIYDYYAYDLTLDALSYFQAGITQRKKEFNYDFFRCLRKLYMMCPEANKLTFQKEFVKEWQYYPIDYCPYFETIIPDFFKTLETLLEKISEDPENVEKEDFEELRWTLLVSPVSVLLRLFRHVIRNPSTMIDFTLKLCRSVDVLFHDRPLKIYHNEYEVHKVEPLLCVVIRRFVCCCRCEATPPAAWEALAKLSIEFCKGEDPLLNAWILLDITLNEIYSPTKCPTKSVEILTGLAANLLAPENQTPFDFKFAASMRTQPAEKLFLAPTIIDMLLKLMTDYQQKRSLFVVDNCKRALKDLSVKMREQNVQFDEETKNHVLGVLRSMPWWVEYTMSTWFDALNVEKRRVPLVIFAAIYPDSEEVSDESVEEEDEEEKEYDTADETEDEEVEEKEAPKKEEKEEPKKEENEEKFILIETDKPIVNLPFEYLRSIMHLGLFDAESALDLLHTKTCVQYELKDLQRMMKEVLESSFLKQMGMFEVDDARVLVMQILEVFDKSTLDVHETIAKQLIQVLPVPNIHEDFPKWTHNIVKSQEIQSLIKPPQPYREPWPPAESNYVPVCPNKIREEQQRHREHLMKLAVAKADSLIEHFREKNPRKAPVEYWGCRQEPLSSNEPTFLRHIEPVAAATPSKSPSSHDSMSPRRWSRGDSSSSPGESSSPEESPSSSPEKSTSSPEESASSSPEKSASSTPEESASSPEKSVSSSPEKPAYSAAEEPKSSVPEESSSSTLEASSSAKKSASSPPEKKTSSGDSSSNNAGVLSPEKSPADGTIEYDDTLVEQMENEMRGVRMESNTRFAMFRRGGPNQVLGGSSKRGGRRL